MFRQLLSNKNISKATSLALLLLIGFGLIQLSMANGADANANPADIAEDDDVEHSIHILFCAS